MDLDTIERKHLEDIDQFERELEIKARTMTLAEVDEALMRLPASPDNDRDLITPR